MENTETLAESIRNYLESGVDLLLTDDDFRTIIKALEQEPKTDCDAISRQAAIKSVARIAKVVAKSDKQKSLCGRIIFMLEHMSEVSE